MVCTQDLSLISVAMCPTQDLWTSIQQFKKKKNEKDESRYVMIVIALTHKSQPLQWKGMRKRQISY